MEIPESLNVYLKPVVITQPVDEKQLPPNLSRQFDSIVSHFQNRRGNFVLFYGASSSENAFAACLLAKRIHRDVYRIDLSAAVSNYVGETEKHLLQIFEFAREHGFVLLFDEADNLFSKQSDIHTDDVRYDNLDIHYLLKRITEYPEMVIITTSARENLDETLLRALPWQVNLAHPVKRSRRPLLQRLFQRLHISS